MGNKINKFYRSKYNEIKWIINKIIYSKICMQTNENKWINKIINFVDQSTSIKLRNHILKNNKSYTQNKS